MKSDLKLHAPSLHFDRIRSQPGVQVSNHLVIVLLMFWIYIFCTIFGEQVAATVIMLIAQFAGFDWGKYRDAELVMELFLTTVCIGLTIVCCCGIESRPLRTMYLTRRKMLPDYLTGVLLGFGLMTVVVLAAWGSGAVRLEVSATVHEAGGRTVTKTADVDYDLHGRYVGLRPCWKGTVQEGPQKVELALVGADGKGIEGEAAVEVILKKVVWHNVMRDWSWTSERQEVEVQRVAVVAGGTPRSWGFEVAEGG